MPKIIETTVYEYHELPTETAKAKAREWLSEAATDCEWYEPEYQDAQDVRLKITGFDLYQRGITIEIEIEIETSAPEVAEAITGNHGNTCETWKAAHDYLRDLKALGEAPDSEETSIESPDYQYRYEQWNEAKEKLDADFLKNLRRCYLHLLDQEYEYLTSDEHLAEFAESNGYTFTEMGKRFG